MMKVLVVNNTRQSGLKKRPSNLKLYLGIIIIIVFVHEHVRFL